MAAKFSVRFHSEKGAVEGKPHTMQVVGRLARPRGIFVDDFKFLASVTHRTPKITLPSPSVMHFRGGRSAISSEAYPDMQDFYSDLARVYQRGDRRSRRRRLPLPATRRSEFRVPVRPGLT